MEHHWAAQQWHVTGYAGENVSDETDILLWLYHVRNMNIVVLI
jgi:hypothetical protein